MGTAASEITLKSATRQIIKNFKERKSSCGEDSFRVPEKVQHKQGPSPKSDSAGGFGHHQCRGFPGMAVGRCEQICTWSEVKTSGRWTGVKKGTKEATSLQEKNRL